MIGPILLSVLLANAAAVPQASDQAAAKPATSAPAQDPSEKPWPPEGVFKLGEGLTAPVIVTEAKPKYTAAAMRAKIEGTVEVEAIILKDGSVGPVRVVRSLDKELGLDEAAIAAVKQWEFKPGRKDGEAVAVLVNIELTFKIRDKR